MQRITKEKYFRNRDQFKKLIDADISCSLIGETFKCAKCFFFHKQTNCYNKQSIKEAILTAIADYEENSKEGFVEVVAL